MKAARGVLIVACLLMGCEIDELDPSGQAGEGTTPTEVAAGGNDGQANPQGGASPGLSGTVGAGGAAQGQADDPAAYPGFGPDGKSYGQGPDGTFYAPPGYVPGHSGGLVPGDVGIPWTPGMPTPKPGASQVTMPTPPPMPTPYKATPTPYKSYAPVPPPNASWTPKPYKTLQPRSPATYTNSLYLNFVTTEVYGQTAYRQPALSWPLALKKGPLAIKVVSRSVKGRPYAGPHRLELQRVAPDMSVLEKTTIFDMLGTCEDFALPAGVSIRVPSGMYWGEYRNSTGEWLTGPKFGCAASDSPPLFDLQATVEKDGLYRLASVARNSIYEISCQQETLMPAPTPTPTTSSR